MPLGSAEGDGTRMSSESSVMVTVPIVVVFLRPSMSSLTTSYRSIMLTSLSMFFASLDIAAIL